MNPAYHCTPFPKRWLMRPAGTVAFQRWNGFDPLAKLLLGTSQNS